MVTRVLRDYRDSVGSTGRLLSGVPRDGGHKNKRNIKQDWKQHCRKSCLTLYRCVPFFFIVPLKEPKQVCRFHLIILFCFHTSLRSKNSKQTNNLFVKIQTLATLTVLSISILLRQIHLSFSVFFYFSWAAWLHHYPGD